MIALSPAPGVLPAGRRVYAVGDVHGCAERLGALHERIAEDLARRPVEEAVLVHLGDYVDRGPDSAGVVARLLDGPRLPGARVVNLRGNHEQTMLEALEGDGAAAIDWLFGGGRAALESWGIDPAETLQADWVIPAAHHDFLRGTGLWYREGGYLFVHAGLRPGVALEAQTTQDLLGIRAAFLHSEASFGAVVVHGHTPRQAPEVRANRINVDTGAVFGGALTCVVLEGETLAFIEA